MIVFLCGPDDFRRLKKREFVVEQFLEKHPLGTVVFFGEEDGAEKLQSFLRQESLFEGKKLGIVSDLEACPGLVKTWKEAAKNPETTLVVESKKIPPKSSPLGKGPVVKEEFPILHGREWKEFLKKQAKEAGLKISAEALSFLAEVFEGESWAAATEMEKLSSMGKEISVADLASLDLRAAPEFWPLLYGARSVKIGERLGAFAALAALNEPAAKTFNILASLWNEKAPQFAEHDTNVKSGKLEYEEALLSLILG